MNKFCLLISISALIFLSCSAKKEIKDMNEGELRAYANELAHRFIITDGHVDLPYLLREKKITLNQQTVDMMINTTLGEFDYERAKKGGLDAPFMSIYIPVQEQRKPHYGRPLADSMINDVISISKLLPDKFALANSPSEVEANFKAGKISLPMGMENGAPIGQDIANLKYFFDRGIRYITLTHNKDNQICDASRDTSHTWNGLSPFGRNVVREMNRLGIMIDISHVDDSTFYQVMKLSKAPCIASHSSVRYFAPNVMRDMNDDMITTMKLNGGVIMINFYPAFLDSTANRVDQQLDKILSEKGLKSSSPEAAPIIKQFRKDYPTPANVETVANHIDRVVKLAGIDHVGLGSDYDGTEGSLPRELEDVSTYPNLIYTLLKRGYSEPDIQKICSGNLFRVWNKVIEVSDHN